MADTEARWYVAHTYSGYENKVKTDLEQNVQNNHLEDQILEVSIPMVNVVEKKDGVERTVQKKMFPAYVLINMVMNDETWYVVRNTRGVTGFVGPGSKPVPLTEQEMKDMGIKSQETDTSEVGFSIGDSVLVKSGVWEDTTGIVRQINHSERTATIYIDMFGRETPVEISFDDIEKVEI
ncbi:MAG: transcription termination/antitermination protein NusG [Lachnospiraceae bacterium]|nr:transcription termination/antitermination protein NusG [Lachnospiraceae bacterium]